MRAFLVAGSPEAERPHGISPGPGDWVAAVDSGLLHAEAWGWPIDLLIGDLDSLAASGAAGRRAFESRNSAAAEVITAPPAKDETDLELALREALRRGADEIVICAALGGRADHMLANVFLLARPELAGRTVSIVEGKARLQILRGGDRVVLPGAAGDLLSLLPLGGPAAGVTTESLLYPLHDETLAPGEPRGVSNVFQGEQAVIALREGCLLVYHLRGSYV